MWQWICAAVGVLGLLNGVASKPDTSVQVGLRTPWSAPHLLLEIGEYVRKENATAYFSYISAVSAALPEPSTPQRLYEHARATLQQQSILPDDDLAYALLDMTVAMHLYAPRVEADYQHYRMLVSAAAQRNSSIPNDCPVWIDWHGQSACSVDALVKLAKLKKGSQDASSWQLPSEHQPTELAEPLLAKDRVLSESPNDNVAGTAILYGDITAPEFREMHEFLVSLTRSANIRYVLRWKPTEMTLSTPADPLWLAGYGVSLSLKSTEYLVLDDRGNKNEATDASTQGTEDGEPLDVNELDAEELFAKMSDQKPRALKSDEIALLGMQAVQLITKAKRPLRALTMLTGGFPKYAPHLTGVTVTDDLRNELGRLQASNAKPEMTGLWINGVPISMEYATPFQVLRLIRSEHAGVIALRRLGLKTQQVMTLLFSAHRPNAAAQRTAWLDTAYDVRDKVADGEAIVYLNDIEKDSRYADWARELFSIVQPMRPGQMIRMAKNLVTAQAILDLSDPDALVSISRDMLDVIQNNIPIRFSVVPLVGNDEQAVSTKMAKLFYYFAKEHGRKSMIEFLEQIIKDFEKQAVMTPNTWEAVERVFPKLHEELIAKKQTNKKTESEDAAVVSSIDDILASTSAYTKLTDAALAMCRRLGLSPTKESALYVNGKHHVFSPENYRQDLARMYQNVIPFLQQKLFDGTIDETTDIYNYFLTLPQVRASASPYAYEDAAHPLTWVEPSHDMLDTLSEIKYLAAEDKDTSKDAVKVNSVNGTAVWLLVDLSSAQGITLAQEVLKLQLKDGFRLAVMNTAPEDAKLYVAPSIFTESAHTVQAALSDAVEHAPAVLQSDYPTSEVEQRIKQAARAQSGHSYIVVNGRIIGPITEDEPFTEDDLTLLLEYEREKRIAPIHGFLSALPLSKEENYYDLLACACNVLGHVARTSFVGDAFDKPTAIHRDNSFERIGAAVAMIQSGVPRNSAIRMQAVVDPLTEVAQKWAPFFEALSELPDVSVQVFMNPDTMRKELPLKRFYQFLLPTAPEFNSDTGAVVPSRIAFSGIPIDTLLTMGLDTISAWIVMPAAASHDLDNIKLTQSDNQVDATFELEHLLVEGHARQRGRGSPRGLQLVLSDPLGTALTDTIVMANFGYFQVRAQPGLYELAIREGRSARHYLMDRIDTSMWSADTSDLLSEAELANNTLDARVVIDSFEGVVLFPVVQKRAGYEDRSLLSEGNDADGDDKSDGSNDGIVNKLKQTVASLLPGQHRSDKSGLATTHADINIFSVASGHLYERFLAVMMTSVMKHTKSSVKFWFIENFLSPTFKDFLPHLAQELGFQYELITYQWPHWVRRQTEKQRMIWAYKILFLDVLFPLSLDKVIFVDADQIVRADLKELIDLDLHGAPYGYTPFCSDRSEMDGYRFWRDGYWKQHLRGKPYHISALYVVDLARFRAMAAGDILRGQYQALSADPNSLANLDQDLPNDLQHDVPIFSLPQEWLWCETWCSDASLTKAKTIDLCNNPLTKEPKLDRARRQVPEWVEYDAQVAEIAKRAAAAAASQADTTTAHSDTAPPQETKTTATEPSESVEAEIEESQEAEQQPEEHDEL